MSFVLVVLTMSTTSPKCPGHCQKTLEKLPLCWPKYRALSILLFHHCQCHADVISLFPLFSPISLLTIHLVLGAQRVSLSPTAFMCWWMNYTNTQSGASAPTPSLQRGDDWRPQCWPTRIEGTPDQGTDRWLQSWPQAVK